MRNFAFPGYAKHVWTRSTIRARHPFGRGRMPANLGLDRCQTDFAAGLERPLPSGDRWLRPMAPNLEAGSAPGTCGGADSGIAVISLDVWSTDWQRKTTRLSALQAATLWNMLLNNFFSWDRLSDLPSMATPWHGQNGQNEDILKIMGPGSINPGIVHRRHALDQTQLCNHSMDSRERRAPFPISLTTSIFFGNPHTYVS